jgi:hypothetical protein
MKTIRKVLGLLVGVAAVASFHACSAKSGDPNEQGLFQNGGGRGNGFGWDSSLGGGFSGSTGTSGTGGGVVFNPGNTGGSRAPSSDACPAIRQKPEQIIVYRDATVTDTITTYKPVALFIMQDRSGSMVTGFPPPADPNNWNNSTAAITAFVNDPQTAGILIGLGTFPYGPNNTADCTGGSDCGTPVVPIAPLPQNGNAMIQAMNAQQPSNPIALTPIECGLRGMINECLRFMAGAPNGEQCVAILVTDGTPTQCDGNQANLQAIIADGKNKGVLTFALGLPGADLNQLNGFANAGGTGQAIDVGGGAQNFINALNNIRQKVTVTSTQVISTPMTIATPLPCSWTIPPAPAGTTFDKDKVNVQFTPPGATVPVDFGRVNDEGQCGQTTQDAWYYDNPASPTKVLACPHTCNGTLHNSAGAEVAVLFGCDSKFIFH